jgi:2-iminobutanoate/2-iminopropanoate deaminase
MVGVAFAADPKVVSPANGVPLVGPYSPGLDTGDYVYVSGQGVRDSKSQMPEGIEAQTRQCVENVRGILSAAGLGLDSVVAVQLYLADLGNLPVVEQIYGAAFPKGAARVTLGVAKMPTDTTVEITVVARRAGAKADRVFVPAVYGNTQAEVEAKLAGELKKVGLAAKDVVYANRYVVGGEGAGTIPVAGLPGGAKRALFAIAAKTPPVGMAFCEVVASDVGGTVEEQTKSVFGKLQACLEGKGLGLSQALATNVYLDQIGDFAKMNAVYATYFPNQKPTRTTIQTAVSGGAGHPLVRLSALAGR